jgi:two-component system, sensor histidine kinase and response regulator
MTTEDRKQAAEPAGVLRVLVVDDEAGMRSGVERALKNFSVSLPDSNGEYRFVVAQADSGEKALAIIRADRPDLLLLDHKLPGLSGLEVLEQIAGRNDDLLTVMITAYASLQTAITATKRGAFDFLAKPFTPEELRESVRRAARHLLLQRQARKLAEERRQVRFQLTTVVAHEMKAPLAAIQTYLEIVRAHSAGDDPKTYEHMLDRSLIRLGGMQKLIGDLLDLTRIEAGTKHREPAPVDVRAVAAEVVESYAHAAAEAKVVVNLAAGASVAMTADRGEIEIVLNNLVSNAIKYNREGGRVDVTLASSGRIVMIVVADTGIGLTAAESARLFNDFVRIRNAKTRNILGSGLGLSIVKKLAAMYGGDVTVHSEPDVGTTFTVTLESHEQP